MRTVHRVTRLMEMIRLFQCQCRGYTIMELSERFHVSPWTVRRDLKTLQDEPLRIPLVRIEDEWTLMAD
jgi:predicted DNA-binding transcriptional regulator YafY